MSGNERSNRVDGGFSMSLGEHLEELRVRLIRSMFVVAAAFIAAWIFREGILSVLFQPHVRTAAGAHFSSTLKFRDYMEPVAVQLKACLAVAAAVAMPYLLYQIWAFVAPGLYSREQRFFRRMLCASILCFLLGGLFGYFVFIPMALGFLLSLAPAQTEPMLMIGPYLSLFLTMSVALGIIFQIPLVVYYLVRWDIVSASVIKSHRRHAVLGAFILSAFFTPPDPGTQVMMAVPVIVLYELGLLIASPARESFLGFIRLAGIIGLVVLSVSAWYHYRPAGRVEKLDGEVHVNGVPMEEPGRTALRRGAVIEVGETGRALLHFGLLRHGSKVALDGGSRASVHKAAGMSLAGGAALAVNRSDSRTIGIALPEGEVRLRRGIAEVRVIAQDGFKVTVAEGSAEVIHGGRSVELPAGRARVFMREGTTAEGEALRERWEGIYPDR